MRLHHLTVSAFGPFAGTEHVDFDELNDAGLFLLTGPTGAGKSSLLDAVCFALYGTVPGARGVKTLKSQHADAHAAPEVVLDFSVQGRRFVLRRTPEWSRPKKRGEGLLVEKASASITETTTGTDHFLSARAAEVGLLVTELMGMNAGQFVQVALLPQGEFQTFLRASSKDRQEVLQHLFRTDRFTRIEEWVDDHSRRLRTRSQAGESGVRRLLDTIADRAGVDCPEEVAGDALPTAAAEDRVLPWVRQVRDDAEAAASQARGHDAGARRRLDAGRDRLDLAERRAGLRARRDTAAETLLALDRTEEEARSGRTLLAAHERATGCRPVLGLLRQAVGTRQDAARLHDRAVRDLGSASAALGVALPDPLTPAGVEALTDQVRGRVARLEAVLSREQAAEQSRRELRSDRLLLEAAEHDQLDAATRADELPAELDERVSALERITVRAVRHEALTLALTTARRRLEATVALDGLEPQRVTLDDERRDARDRVQDARDRVQQLVSRRLAGMAAELAGTLADGVPCQVCGSADHPHPARPAADAVTDREQQVAERDLTARQAELAAREEALALLRSRQDSLRATADGLGTEQAGALVEELTGELADAAAARREPTAVEREILALRDEQARLVRRRSDATASVAGLRQSVAGHERTLSEVAAELAEARGDALLDVPGDHDPQDAVPGVGALLDRLRALTPVLTGTRRSLEHLEAAVARAAELEEQALATVRDQGFGSVDEVDQALLPDAERGHLVTVLAERDDARTRARALLDDPDFAGLDDAPADDLDGLRTEVEAAAAEAAESARVLALHDERVRALRDQHERITATLEDWAPARDESLRAESMSRLVRGLGHDNHLQMRLSAYVLATRLDQVVAAANERLGHLRDQRYLLQRTGKAERRRSQAGLGLEVLDQWTGDVRSPATLSGGETFVVSLSLALGLADVVTQEAGGTEIETLFVDEGFGTLDADTLDDVMDRLDSLRAGGRTVGVVSHVTELRSRIPTQVQVEKGRTGSVVTVRTLVG